MPSDKRNLITAIATGLISSLFNVASSGDVPFRQPKQLQCLHHGSTKAYLCSPLYSIPYCVGDDLQYVHYGFGMRAVQAGEIFTLFFAWNGNQTFEELEVKRSEVLHCVKALRARLFH